MATASPTPTQSTTPTPSPSATPTPSPTLNPADWDHQQQGNISSSGACGNLSGYQIRLTLHYGGGSSNGSDVYLNGHCNANFSDIRFTKADGVWLLDYWMEEVNPGANATVWVEFDDISTAGTQFYIHYGNTSASSESDGYATFLIFNDGTSLDGWERYPGGGTFNWTVTNGVVRCTATESAGDYWSNLYCTTTTGTDYYAAECSIRAQDGQNASNIFQQGIGYSKYLEGFHRPAYPMARWIESWNQWGLRDPSGESYSAAVNDSDFDARDWHDYSFVKDGNYWELFVDGVWRVNRSNAANVGQYIGMYAFIWTTYHWAEFDDFRVRNYCSPEPTFGEWTPDASEPTPTPTASATPTASTTSTATATATATATPTPTSTPLQFGDANMDGAITLIDLARTRGVILGTADCVPAADSNMDGCATLTDLARTRSIVLGTSAAYDMHMETYDFSSGAGTEHLARYKQVLNMPANTFANESGWTAFGGGDYSDIDTIDANDFSMAANATAKNALQCRFTINGAINTSAITDLGVAFNGTTDVLEVWAWNFDTMAWSQIELESPPPDAVILHTTADCWGTVLGDYIDGSSHMYILFLLNTNNRAFNVDYVRMELAYP